MVQPVSHPPYHPQLRCALLYSPWHSWTPCVSRSCIRSNISKYNRLQTSGKSWYKNTHHDSQLNTGKVWSSTTSVTGLARRWPQVCLLTAEKQTPLQSQVCCYMEIYQYLRLQSLIFGLLHLISYLFSPSKKMQLILLQNYEDKRQRVTFNKLMPNSQPVAKKKNLCLRLV